MKSLCNGLVGSLVLGAFVMQFSTAEASRIREKVLHSFGSDSDGGFPVAGLVAANNEFYGTAYSGGAHDSGTVYSLDLATGTRVLYSFCSEPNCEDGSMPLSPLMFANGLLYGTTYLGGAYNCGMVFALDPTTGTETVLHSFDCHDGSYPYGGLIQVNGVFYGTTAEGGIYGNYGIVYSLDPGSGALTVLHSFGSGTDGKYPFAGLVSHKGKLFGTTGVGGAYGEGTVFAVTITGAEKIVYSFCRLQNCTDGESPNAGLIDVRGTLYGTTYGGGRSGAGTVFSFDPKAKKEFVLHSFCHCNGDGYAPVASLIDSKGELYGTTEYGGTGNWGTVFSLNPNTGTETLLHSFCPVHHCKKGEFPEGSLVADRGRLFGTTEWGGDYGYGTLFKITRP